MPDLSQITTFVLTSELGSLAACARKLGISAAAVSKQLTKLEKELGLQLLIRSTRKIELTEIGISYCLQCKRILNEVEEASSLISHIKFKPHGLLKVFSGRHFADKYIIPHLREFLKKYPKIELNLELGERIPDLNAEAIDIMIGMSVSATDDMIQKRIGTTSYVFAASPKYLKEFGIPKKPEDLKNHRYITHSMRRPDNELSFDKGQILTLKPYISVNDVEAMLKLALDGIGIIKVHRYAAEQYIENGQLKELLKNDSDSKIPIYVAYPNRRYISSNVRCFIDFIVEKLRAH